MAKCLVTKLQAVVDDDNLKKMGQIDFVASGITTGDNGYIRVVDGIGGYIVADGTMYSDGARTQAIGNTAEITAASFGVTFSNDTTRISVISKYGITRYETGVAIKIADVGDLAYSPNPVIVSYFAGLGTPIIYSGNIDDLAVRPSKSVIFQKKQDAVTVDLRNLCGSIGNLDKFGFDANGFTNSTVSLRDSEIKGDISAFAAFNSDWKTVVKTITTNQANVGKIYGNIEAFKDYSGIVMFDLNYINITGSLVIALGHMVNLESIAIGGHTGAEDLANLFDALHTNGKTSGSIQIWPGANKTVNGTPWVSGNTVTFTASGWTVA